MQQGGAAEGQITALIAAWALAVPEHAVPGILAHHEQDSVMFDVPRPLQSRGIEEYRKTWDLFFRYHTPSQAFDIEQLAITAGKDAAFAVAIMRCGSDGLLFRLTRGPRHIDGEWIIAHEHHSLPSTE
jgi:ketosteroid isomerase-like protein